MGYRIIADLAGLKYRQVRDGLAEIDDDRWHGYLCNISPGEYETFLSDVPVEMLGSDFLERYGSTTDKITRVEADRLYAVKTATEHAIFENDRVNEFAHLLRAEPSDHRLERMGELMFESHASYAACGLTEPCTERLVDLVRQRRAAGLFGARITGGGSGGTVAIMGGRGSAQIVKEIAHIYQRETGREPYIFRGSSPGSATFGHLRLSGR